MSLLPTYLNIHTLIHNSMMGGLYVRAIILLQNIFFERIAGLTWANVY